MSDLSGKAECKRALQNEFGLSTDVQGPLFGVVSRLTSQKGMDILLAALPDLWARMTPQRADFTRKVLGGPSGGIVLARDMADAIAFVNEYAPEHLEILSTKPFDYLGEITEAAEILMGPHTPVSIANFALGPNAVLPTSQGATTYGPLSVSDFMRRSSIGYVTEKGYPEMARAAGLLADYEGFSSHALAVSELRQRFLKG